MSNQAPHVPPNLFAAQPNDYPDARKAVVTVKGATAPSAWLRLMTAFGTGLQGGMYRAEQSRRRLARLR